MSEVTDLIGAYLTGQITLEKLSRTFRARHWLRVPRHGSRRPGHR